MEKLKIGIGLPAYRGVIASGQMKMWVQLGAAMNRPEVREVAEIGMLADLDMNGIDNARNALVKVARHGGLDWLLMVDSDTWCEPGSALIQMILEADAKGAAAVGAPVRVRGYDQPLNIYRFQEEEDVTDPMVSQPHEDLGGKTRRIRVKPFAPHPAHSPLFEVDAIGAAILAVNIHRIGDAVFSFVEREGVKVSEDIEFCRQLREDKQTILCDQRISTMHVNKPDVLIYSPHQQKFGV